MLDSYPGSALHSNKKNRNANALYLASKGAFNLTHDRIKTINFIMDRNFKSLEHANSKEGMNILHHAIRRDPVS